MSIALAVPAEFQQPSGATLVFRYLRRNKSLSIGLFILVLLIAFTLIGLLVIDPRHAYLDQAGRPITILPQSEPIRELF